jgi:hypothetical protein
MLHFPLFGESAPEAALAPAAYLRLRRQAAGLSIHDAAARIATGPEELRRMIGLLRRLETPGRTALFRGTIENLRAAFPLDAAVYWQLAEDPLDRHPRVCLGCGCTAHDACSADDGTSCTWSTPLRCSRCAAPAADVAA